MGIWRIELEVVSAETIGESHAMSSDAWGQDTFDDDRMRG